MNNNVENVNACIEYVSYENKHRHGSYITNISVLKKCQWDFEWENILVSHHQDFGILCIENCWISLQVVALSDDSKMLRKVLVGY